MEPAWGASWAWGLSLITLTMMVHALGVVMIALGLERLGDRALRRRHARWQEVLFATAVLAGVALLLAVLHSIEAADGRRPICGSIPSRRIGKRSCSPSIASLFRISL